NFQHYQGEKSKINSINTVLERGFDFFQGGRIKIGQTTTDGALFDSIPLEGIAISSDDGMLKPDLVQYTPTIRGIANSPSRVVVKQNGNIIYEKNIPAGEFELNDVTQVYNDELTVDVIESNGVIRTFTQSSAALPVLQRQGRFRYDVAFGRYRSNYDGINYEPNFFNASFAYGMRHNKSIYGRGIFSKYYQASTIGVGKYFEQIGAVSFDASFSSADLGTEKTKKGQMYRAMYSNIFSPTNTTFSLAGYKYQSSDYYEFDDFQYTRNGVSHYNKSSSINFSLSQKLSDKLGSVYIAARRNKYRDNSSDDNLNISYATAIGYANASLALSLNKNPESKSTDKAVYISISVPLERFSNSFKNNYLNVSSSATAKNDVQRIGISGSGMDNQFNYSLYQTFNYKNDDISGGLDASYVGTYGALSAGYYYQDYIERYTYGINGGVSFHEDGLTLSHKLSLNSGNALLKAEGAKYMKIQNGVGIYTDYRGYAVVPNLSAYSKSKISVDVQTINDDVELSKTGSTIIPSRGALVKTEFYTSVGYKVLATLKDDKGKNIPFGSVVSINNDIAKTFITDDNGVVYLTGVPKKGELKVHWGKGSESQCRAKFNLIDENEKQGNLKRINLTCF
ncbi:TPA: fimbrial biogenesis outer membrane usher protein, partial [Escherichia coli]|nr:fimbrial biogenesis outer membrane usher protein [Escherichia coli]